MRKNFLFDGAARSCAMLSRHHHGAAPAPAPSVAPSAPVTPSAPVAAAPDLGGAPGVDGGAPAPDAAGPAGFVPADPFTVDSSRAAITFAQLAAYFAPGATSVQLGTFSVVGRHRQCAEGSCSDWTPSPSVTVVEESFNQLACANRLTAGGTAELDLIAGPSIRLLLNGPVDEIPAGTDSCTDTFELEYVNDADDSGAEALTGAPSVFFPDASFPSGLWFPTTIPNSTANLDGAINLSGRINDDGSFQFVSVLSAETTDLNGANQENQIALYGQL